MGGEFFYESGVSRVIPHESTPRLLILGANQRHVLWYAAIILTHHSRRAITLVQSVPITHHLV